MGHRRAIPQHGRRMSKLCHSWPWQFFQETLLGLGTHVYIAFAWGSSKTTLKIKTLTSSTAQGGGGSFKNRKPIGEVGCCESGMAEWSHWWIERCLISLTLSLSFSAYLPTYLSIFYVSIYRSICLSINLSIYLSLSSNYLSIYVSIYLFIYLSFFLSSVYLSSCLSVYPSIYLSV